MTSTPPQRPDAPRGASGDEAYAAPDPGLQLIAEGVTQLVGFGAAVINIRRGDEFEIVAATGDEIGRTAGSETTVSEMLGTRFPVSVVTDLLEMSVDWGDIKFVPHEKNTIGEAEGYWVPDTDEDLMKRPEDWHRLDELLAPFYDEDGELVGVLSVDRPLSGHRPGRRQQRILNRFARQAKRAVLLTLHREYLEERANNLLEAQAFLREANSQLGLTGVLEAAHDAMSRGLDADGLYVQTDDGDGAAVAYASPGVNWDPSEHALAAGQSYRDSNLWREGQHAIVNRDLLVRLRDHRDPERRKFAVFGIEFLDSVGADSLLVVPIGVETTSLGHLVLLRSAGRPRWTDAEGRLAMEFGRDFGRIVLTSNAYTRERDLAERLATADKVHSRLIESVAQELRYPLTALTTGINAIGHEERGSPTWFQQVGNLISRSDQLVSMVDDLLLFSRFSDPSSRPTLTYVNLSSLLEEVHEQRTYEAEKRGIEVSLDVPNHDVAVMGDRSELKAAILRLVDNALVYTHRGGRVRLYLVASANEVAVSVADNGVGIPAAEQLQIFTEFYRGTSKAVGGRKGVGLGLSIVDRVARRHDGRVTLRSEPGTGTRVSLVLPLGRVY
ncbi:signal transduction histidine kinase [Nocardioides albertanoniae]|uniref:Sensor-like histidine kinase SenX3 n=1 Tax=Nocardioides albertanoniae TaxID=1175486 RepID=A0A543A2Q9_9ACTN|nr:HAMP domain-containing sensor histidine kinase [Nocardioides albertanoniae]TQL66879.1 signal transduction histidine kinase [Nocardioides albertanoniae]